MLTRAQVVDTVEQTDPHVQAETLQRACAREMIKHTDAALRAEVEEMRHAIEVIQSSRDILLHTFCLWQKEWQEGKMALRELPGVRAEVEALQQKQSWIDQVGPPHHPDDERQWVGAYLDATANHFAALARVEEWKTAWHALSYDSGKAIDTLQQTVARLTQENAWLLSHSLEEAVTRVSDLTAQLQQVTQERDAAQKIVQDIAAGLPPMEALVQGMGMVMKLERQLATVTSNALDVKASYEQCLRQLAEAQATIARLEEKR